MKKSIKNLEVKAVKNISAIKGGDGGGNKPKSETTTLGDISGGTTGSDPNSDMPSK